MPVVQLDWVKLKSRLGDVTGLYFLTHRQASLLLSLSEQLTWRKTYRAYEYDFSDWDDVQLEVADLQRYLAMPVNLVDLVGYIDDIEDLLRAAQHLTGCCPDADLSAGDEYTDVVVDGVGDVPQNIIDAGYAEDEEDWEGFYDYKCAISHLMIDHIEQVLRQIVPYIDDTGVIIGGVGTVAGVISGILMAAGGPVVLGILAAVGVAAGLWTLIISFGDELTESLADKVATNHDELACSVYLGDGIQGGVQNLKDKIDELFTATESLILKNTNLDPILKAMYSGRYDQQDVAQRLADRGIDVEDYDCSACVESFDIDIDEDFQTDPPADDLFERALHMQDPNELPNWVIGGDGGITINSLLAYTDNGFSFSPGDKLEFNRVKFDGMKRGTGVTRWIIIHDGGTEVLDTTDGWTIGVWEEDLEFIFNPPLVYTYPGGSQIENFQQDVVSGHTGPFLDNLEMDINVINV
jgi:hypothetical protein